MSINPTWEKFQRATLALARAGGIKERLENAYRQHLSSISEDDLPSAVRAQFSEFIRTMTRERPMLRGEEPFRATVRKMSNTEAEDVACAVVQMFAAVPRTLPRTAATSPRAKSVSPQGAQVVPLFVSEAARSSGPN
jgi:hypothetical protein